MSSDNTSSNNSAGATPYNAAGIPNLVLASNSLVSSAYSSITGPRSVARSTSGRGGGGRYNRKNNRNQNRNINRNNTQQKGKIEDIQLLKHSSENPRRDQFVLFQIDMEQYILKNFKNPSDVVSVVKDIIDPSPLLVKNIPKKADIRKDFGDTSNMSEDNKEDIEDAIQELYSQSMKLFATRRQQLKENEAKIYGIIWGNCTHLLQNEITSMTDYETMLSG